MNDKQIMNDILNDTKALCELYMHGAIEASCQDIHTTFKNVLNDTLMMQKEAYTTMLNNGWYQAENVEQQKIEQAKQKLAQA